MEKKLYRSTTDRKLSGVCAGLADYLNIDVTLVRLLWALVSLFTGGFPGIIVYVVFALVVPEQPTNQYNNYNGYNDPNQYYNNNPYNNNNNNGNPPPQQ